jgi:hemolysin activation/secretion protein
MPHHTLKPLLVALLVAFFPLVAQAAAPGAGTILQEIKPDAPPAPLPTGTGLRIEQEGGAQLPQSAPFDVKTIQISGNTLFETETLHALVADGEGKTLTLAQLDKLVSRITDYYHAHGYPLARAVIPAQVIRDGVVVINIIEARYGKISLDNRSRVNDPLLQDTLSPLQNGQPISQLELDHTLLLLTDIPGVVVNATLKPGETVGTSDLLVATAPSPAIIGNAVLDNYGNRYTGRARIGGTVNFIDPLSHGDILSVGGLTSGSRLQYGRISYESLLNGKGTRLGGSYSALRYTLGDTLASLDAHGTAEVGSLWAKHPLIRRRDVNLYGQIQYDRMQLKDRIDTSAIRTDRHLRNWMLSLSGDMQYKLLSDAAINTWSIGWTTGRVGFDDASAQLADAVTTKTEGRFSKVNANLAHLQSLSPENMLYLAVSGQWANTNLDSSEKMVAGGPYSVRAYDVGAVSGDSGYRGTIEFRRNLGFAWQGQWQGVVFADSAHVTINKKVWIAGKNSATLSGIGLGLNWTGPERWSAKAYIATPVGSTPVLVATANSVRGWVQVSKGF